MKTKIEWIEASFLVVVIGCCSFFGWLIIGAAREQEADRAMEKRVVLITPSGNVVRIGHNVRARGDTVEFDDELGHVVFRGQYMVTDLKP